MNTSSHQLNPYIYNDGSTRNIISSPATRPIQAKPPPNLLSPNDSFAEDLDQLVKTLAMSQCEVYGKLRLVSGIRKVLNNLLAKQKTILQESQNAGGPAQSTSPQNVPSGQDRYKLYLYGSFSNLSTSLPQSDVDICIVTEQQQSFITQIQQCLLSIVAGWMSNTSEIRTTPFLHNHSQAISLTDGPQVPSVNASPTSPSVDYIQHLSHDSVHPHADISAGSINGIINSDLLRELLFYYPPAPTIIFLAKSILSKHHLNEPYIGGIGGYSLSLLVVSHLQMFQRNFNKDWHTTPLFELFLSFLQFGVANRERGLTVSPILITSLRT
ncbi:hypothetical protein BLNAU_15421 [Blattamonas nauphoetae]|uniref:Polymerase nucleotidyl transferase domain-containing protein n=1 Tax=Blattamonas nauphoetae TaxID=2049346 RepID=A0ABQ9XE61_9EUKA|nr:hypothetical protein BLNAU_15421 [Blattamonas nauphoetae]